MLEFSVFTVEEHGAKFSTLASSHFLEVYFPETIEPLGNTLRTTKRSLKLRMQVF